MADLERNAADLKTNVENMETNVKDMKTNVADMETNKTTLTPFSNEKCNNCAYRLRIIGAEYSIGGVRGG